MTDDLHPQAQEILCRGALANVAAAHGALATAIDAARVILDAAPQPPEPPPAPGWMPASEFRGEPGAKVWLWRRRDPGDTASPWSAILGSDGELSKLTGLVCPIPPPPLPDAEPALTPAGVWVRAADFRGEAAARVWLWSWEDGERAPPILARWQMDERGGMDSLGPWVMRVDIPRPAPPVTP